MVALITISGPAVVLAVITRSGYGDADIRRYILKEEQDTPKTQPLPYKKHPAEDFLIATREERALRQKDMPPMISILPEHVPALLRAARARACKIIPFRR